MAVDVERQVRVTAVGLHEATELEPVAEEVSIEDRLNFFEELLLSAFFGTKDKLAEVVGDPQYIDDWTELSLFLIVGSAKPMVHRLGTLHGGVNGFVGLETIFVTKQWFR